MFDEYVNNFVYKGRWAIVIVSLIWFAIVGYYTSRMGPMTEEQKFIADDHPIMKVLLMQRDHFKRPDNTKPSINFYFGVKETDDTNED